MILSVPETMSGDLRISYEVTGVGDPILFLPGTTADSAMWLVPVSTYLEDFKSILVDPRDTAKSDLATTSYTPKDLAHDAVAVLQAEGVEKCHVVGYSLGGAVAQEVAVANPGFVSSLVLICTWAATDEWLRHCFETLREGLDSIGMEWADRAVLWLTLSAAMQSGEAYENLLLLQGMRGQTSEGLGRQLDCDIAHLATGLESIEIPTLVIGGSEDIFIPQRYSRELASKIPGAALEIVEGAAHSLPFENADVLFPIVIGWLKDQL